MMKIVKYPDKQTWDDLLRRPAEDPDQLNESVTAILDDVRKNGDFAVKKYTRALDGADLDGLEISEKAIIEAEELLDSSLKQAIRQAAGNIERFHQAQESAGVSLEVAQGMTCWQRAVPIDSIGIYVPGGTAPLFSSVLMMAVPARVAGCKNIVLTTPPDEDGNIHPAILYSAAMAGVDKIYRVGGAQAIAAMAYGTETIPRVNKIFGPGNQFVTRAKQMVSMEGIAIDMPAGPSELLVVADDSTPAGYLASDLLSQAEHGPDSQVLLLSTHEGLINETREQVEAMLPSLPRADVARKALESCKLILLENQEQIMDMVNAYAPEHLLLATKNAEELTEKVRNAGSVFVGSFTPESLGDYSSGTNHVLPTNGTAKAYSGVNLDSFTKKITFQRADRQGLEAIGAITMKMADAEGLEAHRRAVEIRLNTQK
jgi:histidinol dehydrogenase